MLLFWTFWQFFFQIFFWVVYLLRLAVMMINEWMNPISIWIVNRKDVYFSFFVFVFRCWKHLSSNSLHHWITFIDHFNIFSNLMMMIFWSFFWGFLIFNPGKFSSINFLIKFLSNDDDHSLNILFLVG